MIFQSFILGNLVSLCMKIINSVVVVGLYYGFLTTFSIGPSYLFLLRARVMEEGEEGTEKKVSATTGFITGQLMMFISIYYAPLHLALGRPHTITVLALPYLLFHFFWNNHKHFFDYGSTNRNSMRNLSIQCVFLNNLIFQLFNHFILPSSMLVRLVNIYMFRCNNKMLFVTSSFVGWLIGHILFMKWVGLVLVWIQQNNSIRSNKYLMSELRNLMARIFSILLFITCVYYLGRMPSPILTKKLKETEESEEERDVEKTSETKGTKQEQEGSTEEDPSPSLFSEEKEDPEKIYETEEIRVNGKEKTKDEFHFKETRYKNKNRPVYETYYLDMDRNQENSKLEIFKEKKDLLWFEKPLVTILFDYKRWNRPFRYIKNNRLENAIKNEMSQYFFHTCQSDGKKRISFTYPPSLLTFFEMIQRKMSLFTTDKLSADELYNNWSFTNEQKRKNLNNKFINIIKTLDKNRNLNSKFLVLDVLEKRTRLCHDNTKKKYLPEVYDPFLNGAYRGQIKKRFSLSIKDKISIQNYIQRGWINKIHGLFLIINYLEFEEKKKPFDRIDKKLLSREMSFFLNLINEFNGKPTSSLNFTKFYLFPEQKQVKMNLIDLEGEERKKRFIFERFLSDPNNKSIRNQAIGVKEIRKKVPHWSYKLIDDLEQEEGENEEALGTDSQIRSRKCKRIVIFNHDIEKTNGYSNFQDTNNNDETGDIVLIRYSQQSDFRRDIITGSMRAQRRKTIIWKTFQANVHSLLFLDRIDKDVYFFFDILELIKKNFQNWLWKKSEFKSSDYREKKGKESIKNKKEEEEKKRRENARIEIAETWDSIVIAQVIRGFVLVTQSILRKYIILPSLIIVKNIGRILLFQSPEWSEDLKDWKREVHVNCTYNGVQLAEKEFPKNWLIDGIQIKILFPFRLKPWHKSKLRRPRNNYKDPMKKKEQQNDFCFLTVWGMETELPFGSPRKQLSFFEPIFKELKKKLIKFKKKCFRILIILKERKKLFLNVSKERRKWVITNILFLKKILKELSKMNPSLLVGLREIELDELSENKKEKNLIIDNEIINEPSINIQSTNWTTFSLTKKKIQDLTDRTNTILNQIQKISKDNKKEFIRPHINICFNKMSFHDKKVKSTKNILRLLKRRNVRLIRKSNYFIRFFIERIYINIFLFIINIPRINAQLFFYFFESTKKIVNKYSSYNNYIDNNETTQEKIDKTNQNRTQFISTLKESLSNINNNNLQTFCDLSYLSQAYVFYKLSQTPVFNFLNLYKLRLRSVFQSNGAFLFLKNEIKDYFLGTQKIFNFKLRHNNPPNSEINQWKNRLRGYYQNTLFQSRLGPQKSINIVNQHSIAQTNHLNKWDSYEENPLINSGKKNVKKQYRYDLLSYNFINYEDKKNSSIYRLPLQINHNQEIFYNYNEDKRKFFNMLVGIPINNYLVQDNIINRKTNPDRKNFDWIILNFCLRKKMDIRTWINMDTDTYSNKYIKTKANNYQIIEKIDKKDLFYPTIHQNQEINLSNKKKKLFDWMRMNEEILSCPISNLELWFFPEFLILYTSYKIKPWYIPIKFLLLNFHVNENASENKKKTGKKKRDIFLSIFSNLIFSNAKRYLELEKQNQGKKECAIKKDFESNLSNQEKDIEENYAISKMKKNKKQSRTNMETEFDFLLKRYLLFQLRWDDSLNKKMIDNIKIYCSLLRPINLREITIASIQRGEINLDLIMIQKNFTLTELIKKGILLIEPIRLSIKNEEQFITYQTIGIPLIHKSKHTITQRYRKKNHVDTKNSDEFIPKHQKMTENRNKNHYDLFVPESILSPRRRKELRILICFNSRNRNGMPSNAFFCNENKVRNPVLNKSKINQNTLIKLKFFLWPNYRLEDFACMNRYWFDTNNGSRFSMVRVHMYP
uniref:Protein TIC 214 n=1 Tax=Broussonetia luzonica TaxID=1968119 RepID=A0A6G5QBL4_9ROSA|nr:hypothetical chloroplast RF19 [Broussonetia luzonica]QCA41234.1 hypothetical chloroplast RF19 [Broussonetia luzonica]